MVLFLIAALAIGVAVALAMGVLPREHTGTVALAAVGAGAVAALLILYRLVDLPGPDVEGAGVEIGRQIGIFLGLIAAGGIGFGGHKASSELPAMAPGPAGPAAPQA